MTSRIIVFACTAFLGFASCLFFLNKKDLNSENNYIMLLPIILIVNGLLPHIFPSLKKIGYGTLDFLPNILKRIFKTK